MKKHFSMYLFIWILCFVGFNVVCFVIPNSFTIPEEVDMLIYFETGYYLGIAGQHYKYGASFWAGYGLIIASLIGNLLCSIYISKKYTDTEKGLHLISLIRANIVGLISTFVLGIAVMIIPNLSLWIGVIFAVVVFVYNATKMVSTCWASDIILESETKVKNETSFIRGLTAKSKALYDNTDKQYSDVCKKVYEAIRYSDPKSSESVSEINKSIESKFDDFKNLVKNNDDGCNLIAKELLDLLTERNEICKINK